ncbi:helix-turn-helix transcriptional regulator [Nocardioides sp. CCNWLW239]|uniref:helix-turn-helix transcriptional regulator n=1 Tax=Nocardioides sp. CCNWLW239 TaxID=3128902 RepID=UPI00301AC485
MLGELGLSASALEEEIYGILLGRTSATTTDIAQAVGESADAVLEALLALRDRNLVTRVPNIADPSTSSGHRLGDGAAPGLDEGASWSVTPPDVAFGPAVGQLRSELLRAETALSSLVQTYHRRRPAAPEFFELWEGKQAQAQRLFELERSATRSIWVFQTGGNVVAPVPLTFTEPRARPLPPPPPPTPSSPSGDEQNVSVPTGTDISYRVIVDTAFLTEPSAVRALDERLTEGHDVRVVDQQLIKLAIADESIAMMQVDTDTSVTFREPFVRLATELFHATWRRSRPYLREGTDLSSGDRLVLQLMLSGLTDEAMAKQLGTSSRTVQRRLRAMMDVAEVSSRVQLGWYAMRNNWV